MLNVLNEFFSTLDEDYVYIYILTAGLFFILMSIISKYQISVASFLAILIAVPAFTPALAHFFGYDYYTKLNYALQNDRGLVMSAITTVLIFMLFFVVGSLGKNRHAEKYEVSKSDLSSNQFIVVFTFCMSVCFVFIILFLESSTIISTVYADIKSDTSAFSAATQQLFNVTAALIFSSLRGKKERIIFCIILILFVMYFLLVARRVPAMATVLLVCYVLGVHRLNFTRIIAIVAAIALFDFIGDVRSISINEYLSGVPVPQQFRTDFSLPGGASNVFVTVLGVVDLLLSGTLKFPETFPVALWFTNDTFESRIYESMGYDYNGGMLFTNILLWNFGIIGLCIGGWFSGRIIRAIDKTLRRSTELNVGGYSTAVSVLVLMLIPNITWYSPIAFVNAFLLLSVFYWPWKWFVNFLRS